MLFIIGATGFIGREAVREAIHRGQRVKALARNAERAKDLAASGAEIVEGDADSPERWIQHAARASVLLDLVQPELPGRITPAAIQAVATRRLQMTKRLCAALQTLPAADRPMLMSVSGLDDLTPDDQHRVTDHSSLRTDLAGFAHIGVPVRRAIEASATPAVFVYLGTVYGPGKAFASAVFPKLAAGKFRMPGSGTNHAPQIHVDDAARAIVHLAALDQSAVEGRSFILSDGANGTLAEFLGLVAKLMGAPPPKSAPRWLANIMAGKVLVETATRDVVAGPRALLQTGFTFKYPSYREGLPPTLETLGYTKRTAAPERKDILDRDAVFRVLSVLALMLFIAANVTLNLPQIRRISAGLTILDMRLAYSTTGAYQLLDVLGTAGRRFYLEVLWTLDLVAPVLFGTFLSAAIRRTPLRPLRSLPLWGATFDYAENIAITILLLAYPARLAGLVIIATTFTVLKWTLYAGSVIGAIAGAVQNVVRKRAKKPIQQLGG